MSVQADARVDPRQLLGAWANSSDEWVRYIVRSVLAGAGPLDADEEDHAYTLFRQEKALDARELLAEDPLAVLDGEEEAVEPPTVTSLSQISGVNALISGGVIEPHEGLTILFGENGTGKTGYSRIFKALAASRTADVVLGDIEATSPQSPSATIGYRLGSEARTFAWTGQQGVAPFTRISIFDSPSVSFHVDDDLEYVYVPAALALFNHVIAGIKAVQARIDAAISELRSGSTGLLGRFSRAASVYPLIETLGAATDLEQLRAMADHDPEADVRIATLRRTVAALEADTISAEVTLQQRVERVLAEAATAAQTLARFEPATYGGELKVLANLQEAYRAFRTALFNAADLPAAPDETWTRFIQAGEEYESHLSAHGAHDADRCLYCRQPLSDPARALLGKYSEFLEDKIAGDIEAAKARLNALTSPILSIRTSDVDAYARDHAGNDPQPGFLPLLERTFKTATALVDHLRDNTPVAADIVAHAAADADGLTEALGSASAALVELRGQAGRRAETLTEKKKELVDLEAAAELARSWAIIEQHVRDAKQADRLALLAKPMPGLLRAVTSLAKTASDQMVNESFDALFAQERTALRAPDLQVEFVGRQGRAHRRKVLTGKHKPSKVLSEGEQKVLAMADFLAEARLAGITAPVIFDDPVSSLDHRRINEVAQRVAALADTTQVIVFTHDIFFATTLLNLMATSKRCSYFHITDEDGKGQVTRATGPRWDSINNLKKNINETVQAARSEQSDARAALVRTGYDWIRAWCEVFTETELLQGVTQRYQPNVRMTALPNIKTAALPAAIETVNRVFEEACRYIDGHSQPLPTLNVSPTLAGLEAHWAELNEARAAYLSAGA